MLLPYIDYLLSREIDGLRLLSMTVEDLPTLLHVDKLGHQELLMGSIDLLRDIVSLKTKKKQTKPFMSISFPIDVDLRIFGISQVFIVWKIEGR